MGATSEAKLARLRAFMAEHGYGAVVLTRLENLFWLGGGLDAHVPLVGDQGVATFVVTAHEAHLVTTNIEAPRLRDEELGELARVVELHAVDWHSDRLAAEVSRLAAAGGRVASDVPGGGRELVNLAPLRYSLSPAEVETYRRLGADQGATVAEVARSVAPGETEQAIAGRLASALLCRGITPTVLLVAADERIAAYRHPIPTGKPVERTAMLVAGGRRAGLIVSLTRLVHYGEPPADLLARHQAVCAVDAALISHTVVGAPVSAVFAAGVAAYSEAGFADEWKLHHQGGATGYAGRDYRATLSVQETVQPWQAFAWNPSIAGTKSEDTILATPDGPEILSASPDWPLVECVTAAGAIARPGILVRS